MKYAVLTAKGEVKEHEVDAITADDIERVTMGSFRAMEPDESMVIFHNNDPRQPGLPFNWGATHLLQRRLHPSDQVTGDVLVTGPVDFEGHPTDISDEAVNRLREVNKR